MEANWWTDASVRDAARNLLPTSVAPLLTLPFEVHQVSSRISHCFDQLYGYRSLGKAIPHTMRGLEEEQTKTVYKEMLKRLAEHLQPLEAITHLAGMYQSLLVSTATAAHAGGR